MKDINLLPEDLKDKEFKDGGGLDNKESIEPKKILIGLVIVFGLAVVFFLPFLYNKYLENDYKNTIKEIESEKFNVVREVNAEMITTKELVESKSTIVATIDNQNVKVNEILLALKSILPEGCNITNVRVTKGIVNISGQIKEKIQVGEIIARAERFKFFKLSKKSSVSYNNSNSYNFSFDVIPAKGG